MKIGLLNLVVDTNYGGNLQRFALCFILKQLGHEPLFIRIDRDTQFLPKKKVLFLYLKRFVLKLLGRYKAKINKESLVEREYALQMNHIDDFIRWNVPCFTKSFHESDDLDCFGESCFDAYIVGSDQVWRSSPEKHIERFFFDFLSERCKARKIAYAASFGNGGNGYTRRQVKICGELYSRFTSVSVRESDGVDIIKRFGWNCESVPQVVLDPTFLVSRSVYSKLSRRQPVKSISGCLFCYILDIDKCKKDFVERTAFLLKKEVVWLDTLFPNVKRNSFKEKIEAPSIEQWLYNIETADFIVTDSFHGTVFSIIFNKPFITIKNLQRGVNRFSYILQKLGLESRLVGVDDKSVPINEEIDWTKVNYVLEQERQRSILFLKKSLA